MEVIMVQNAPSLRTVQAIPPYKQLHPPLSGPSSVGSRVGPLLKRYGTGPPHRLWQCAKVQWVPEGPTICTSKCIISSSGHGLKGLVLQAFFIADQPTTARITYCVSDNEPQPRRGKLVALAWRLDRPHPAVPWSVPPPRGRTDSNLGIGQGWAVGLWPRRLRGCSRDRSIDSSTRDHGTFAPGCGQLRRWKAITHTRNNLSAKPHRVVRAAWDCVCWSASRWWFGWQSLFAVRFGDWLWQDRHRHIASLRSNCVTASRSWFRRMHHRRY